MGRRMRAFVPFLFLAPALAFGVVFVAVPIGFAFYLSFTNFQAFVPSRFVGFDNYVHLFARDPFFFQTLGNTFLFAAGAIALGVPLALVTAYAYSGSRLKPLWRSLYWLPMATNVVAVAFVWRFVLDDSTGIVNQALDRLALPGPGWLTDPSFAMLSVILVFVWMHMGRSMLVLSAAIENLDEGCFEAARLDGANAWQLFRRVAVPLLRPTLLFVIVTDLITCLSSFPLMLVLTEGGPAHATTPTALYMYQMAFADLRLGRASAAAFVLALLILVLTLVQLRFFRRGGLEGH